MCMHVARSHMYVVHAPTHVHVCVGAHVLQTPGDGGREQRLQRPTYTSLWVSQLLHGDPWTPSHGTHHLLSQKDICHRHLSSESWLCAQMFMEMPDPLFLWQGTLLFPNAHGVGGTQPRQRLASEVESTLKGVWAFPKAQAPQRPHWPVESLGSLTVPLPLCSQRTAAAPASVML